MVFVITIGSFIVAGIAVGAAQSFFTRIFGFRFTSRLQFSLIFVFGMLMAGILWSLYRGEWRTDGISEVANSAIRQTEYGGISDSITDDAYVTAPETLADIDDVEESSATTYFVDDNSHQGSTIILEPDGTCAYLATFATGITYYYGNYESSADGIVLHLTLDDGSILDIPFTNNGSSLAYTGTEAIRLTYPGAIYDKSEGIPESVQLFPPYIDSNVDSQELSMEEAQKLIEEYYMTLPNAEKPPKLEYSMLVETASGSFHEFFQFDLSGEKANDMYAVDANTGKIFMYSLAWDHYIPIEEYMQATFAFTDPWTGVRLDPGTGDEIDTGIFVITTADPSLNMRTGPDLGYDIIGEIPVGTTVEWLGEEGDWSLVEYQHYTGYVSTAYIEESYTVPIS